MFLSLQADNMRLDADITKMSAMLRVHEALVQVLQIQIARLKKRKFGASSERIEREIEQLALEYLEIAGAAAISAIVPDDDAEFSTNEQAAMPSSPRRRKSLVAEGHWSQRARLAIASCWTPGMIARTAAAPFALLVRTSARSSS